eukprot:Skav214772  [mRNA]  locus=scaffold3923:18507:27693:- [translate_table: standard]
MAPKKRTSDRSQKAPAPSRAKKAPPSATPLLDQENAAVPTGTAEFCAEYSQHYRPATDDDRVTDSFVDTSITMSKRVFSITPVLNLLLAADELEGNPFDSWTKLQVLVQKSKNSKNIIWVFNGVYDGWKNGHLTQEMLTWRGLKDALNGRGTVDMLEEPDVVDDVDEALEKEEDETGMGLTPGFFSAVKPPSGGGSMQRYTTVKHLLWCEKSLRDRKHRDKGSVVNQMEKDKDETWRMPLSQKKLLFGPANRVPVGGKPEVEGSDKHGRRRDVDEEPVSEIFEEFNVSHMLDLTCCDGKAAYAAICKRVPYIGIVFTQEHASLLMKRLEYKVFQAMQTAGSPLYEASLAAVLTEDMGQDEDDDANGEDEDEGDDEEKPGKGTKRKANRGGGNGGKGRGKAKSKAKAKAKSKGGKKPKAKATAKGRPKAGMQLGGFKYELHYASEINLKLRNRLKKLYKPRILSGNCMKVKKGAMSDDSIAVSHKAHVDSPKLLRSFLFNSCRNQGLRKGIDVFGAGVPCQPYSAIGKKKGSKDKRANVFKRAAWLVLALLCRAPASPEHEEKARVMGWDPAELHPENMSASELGHALGNAWPLPVSTAIVKELVKCMGWK